MASQGRPKMTAKSDVFSKDNYIDLFSFNDLFTHMKVLSRCFGWPYYLARILPALKFHQLVGLFRLFEYKRLKISLSLAYHIAIGNAFDISQKAVPRFEPMPAAHKVPYGPFSQELPRTQSWLTFEIKRNLSNDLRFIRLRILEFLLKWFDNDFPPDFGRMFFGITQPPSD